MHPDILYSTVADSSFATYILLEYTGILNRNILLTVHAASMNLIMNNAEPIANKCILTISISQLN